MKRRTVFRKYHQDQIVGYLPRRRIIFVLHDRKTMLYAEPCRYNLATSLKLFAPSLIYYLSFRHCQII